MGRREQHHRQPQDILPLPLDVRSVAQNGRRCTNLGLWLDRYLTVQEREWKITERAKERQQVLALAPQQSQWADALQQRFHAILDWYKARGFEVRCLEVRPVWRFVVGLGAAHVLETGITLHRIFGLPIIPGSALKGAARSYAQLVEGKSEDDQQFVAIFGTTDAAGSVIFFDAIPLELPKFQLDIMNPHYPNYYGSRGEKPPADYESPNPVFFLTVSGTLYCFAIAARSEQGNHLLDLAEQWLKGALGELGIGAKTSADYGYWAI